MSDVDWYQRACELAELYGRALANMEPRTYTWDNYDDAKLRQLTEDAASDLRRHQDRVRVWGTDGIKHHAMRYQRYLNELHRRAEKLNWGPKDGEDEDRDEQPDRYDRLDWGDED
jgi:hypothetical protein